MSMTRDEVDAFLDLGLVGAIATLRADGSPWVVPIWYRWDGEAITVWSSPTMGWVKRLREEPRVAFSVYEHGVPSRAIYVRGTATVRDGTTEELFDELQAITTRYVDAERLDDFMQSYDRASPAVIITIIPTFIKGEVN